MSNGSVALILAAGQGERFEGDSKLLAPLEDRPLVAHAVATAVAAGFDDILLVTGHDGDRVATAASTASALATLHVVPNPDYPTGQASSLRCGIVAAERLDADAVVVLLGDQPGLDPDVVAQVRDAVGDDSEVVRARYTDGPGHPVAFAASTFPRLRELTGDEGARQILHGMDVTDVPVDADTPPDVDTADDLANLNP